jgi:UDP-galactopyranose mutase
MPKHYLIVGAGFSGCVLANRLCAIQDCVIEIWDSRDHIGGNSHTSRDTSTGIMVHHYGPHIFNTDKKEIWDFVNSFGEFKPYVHRVKAVSKGRTYALPVNLATINQFFNKNFNPQQASAFISSLGENSITEPSNFEEQALKFIGRELYEAFFYGYTKKQWGCEPALLPASILKRLPVRFNYDDNYHNAIYTGIPVDGYSALMEKMIEDRRIILKLNQSFSAENTDTHNFDHVFYTGPIDAYYNYAAGRLGYRTVEFERFETEGDFQGTTQMNYCDEDIPYTRIAEHKHFTPWEQHNKTIYFKEYSKETGENDLPYYPKRLSEDKERLMLYRDMARQETKTSFLGRLATYRYMDMHHVIGEAFQFAKEFNKQQQENQKLPVFPNEESI